MAEPATVLIGFMGAGKTTVARRLDPDAVDTDGLVEARAGKPVAEVFAEDGEAAFRALEEEVVLEALARGGTISLGGGAVLSARVQEALAGHVVVWLDVDETHAWSRCAGSGRPLATDRAAFSARFAERLPVYARLANISATDAGSQLLLRAIALARAGFKVVLPRRGGPAVFGRGALDLDRSELAGGRAFLVTDEHVAPLHAGRLRGLSGMVEIPPGEEHKTLQTAERVWRALAEQGVTRADHVVALGGGVVGDLAGFCAAAYQRGVPVVQIPTTLVAQVDSAFGGKTGVDLPEAKNYVGAYHQPAAVLVDGSALDTLPREELAAGYAEVVKTALIAGGDLWDRVGAGEPVDDDVVYACARTKLRVVDADERDGGRRQVLNLGHTVGHAIETVTSYGRYRHGEAVALGLLAALRLSGQDALREQVAGLLAAAGLPTHADASLDAEAVVRATTKDKKRLGEQRTPFVLVRAPGDVVHGQDVGAADLLAAVRELAP